MSCHVLGLKIGSLLDPQYWFPEVGCYGELLEDLKYHNPFQAICDDVVQHCPRDSFHQFDLSRLGQDSPLDLMSGTVLPSHCKHQGYRNEFHSKAFESATQLHCQPSVIGVDQCMTAAHWYPRQLAKKHNYKTFSSRRCIAFDARISPRIEGAYFWTYRLCWKAGVRVNWGAVRATFSAAKHESYPSFLRCRIGEISLIAIKQSTSIRIIVWTSQLCRMAVHIIPICGIMFRQWVYISPVIERREKGNRNPRN